MCFLVEVLVSAATVWSAYLTAIRHSKAPHVYVAKEVCWVLYEIATQQYGLLISSAFLLSLGIPMFKNWDKHVEK